MAVSKACSLRGYNWVTYSPSGKMLSRELLRRMKQGRLQLQRQAWEVGESCHHSPAVCAGGSCSTKRKGNQVRCLAYSRSPSLPARKWCSHSQDWRQEGEGPQTTSNSAEHREVRIDRCRKTFQARWLGSGGGHVSGATGHSLTCP